MAKWKSRVDFRGCLGCGSLLLFAALIAVFLYGVFNGFGKDAYTFFSSFYFILIMVALGFDLPLFFLSLPLRKRISRKRGETKCSHDDTKQDPGTRKV
jgi:hypothetical protein